MNEKADTQSRVAEAFTHLGVPAYFRVERSWLEPAAIGESRAMLEPRQEAA